MSSEPRVNGLGLQAQGRMAKPNDIPLHLQDSPVILTTAPILLGPGSAGRCYRPTCANPCHVILPLMVTESSTGKGSSDRKRRLVKGLLLGGTAVGLPALAQRSDWPPQREAGLPRLGATGEIRLA